jgi:hypothetical protein
VEIVRCEGECHRSVMQWDTLVSNAMRCNVLHWRKSHCQGFRYIGGQAGRGCQQQGYGSSLVSLSGPLTALLQAKHPKTGFVGGWRNAMPARFVFDAPRYSPGENLTQVSGVEMHGCLVQLPAAW